MCRVAISVGFRQFWEGSQKAGAWGNSEKEDIRKWWQQQYPAHDTNRIFPTKILYLEISHDNIIIISYSSIWWYLYWGFPDSSVGKESACNAGELNSISGSGRSAGEGIGYPLQYSWASFLAQLVKNLPAMWKTWVRSLGWEDPLGKGKATQSSILAWWIPWTV